MKRKLLVLSVFLLGTCFLTSETSANCLMDPQGGCYCYEQMSAGQVIGFVCSVPGGNTVGTCVCPPPID